MGNASARTVEVLGGAAVRIGFKRSRRQAGGPAGGS